MLLGRQVTWHTQSVAHCLWKIRKIAVYRHLLATISQHWQHFQVNALSISAITRSKPKITHNGL